MPAIVNYADVTEVQLGTFATEASDIGLHPGEWPRLLETTVGNRQVLVLHHLEKRDGDVLFGLYRQNMGSINVKVFND